MVVMKTMGWPAKIKWPAVVLRETRKYTTVLMPHSDGGVAQSKHDSLIHKCMSSRPARIEMNRGLAVDKIIAPEHVAGNDYDG